MTINFEDVKEFVSGELETAELFANTREEVMNCRAIAFGAILFAKRNDICTHEEVVDFWDEWAWEKFEEVARTKGKGPKVEVI